MGTEIVSLLFAAIPFKAQWLYWLAVFFLGLNAVLFTCAFLVSVVRYTVYPEIWTVMIADSTNSLFLGTIPMGFATLISAWCTLCIPYWGPWAVTFAWVCWMIDSVVSVTVTISLKVLLISATNRQNLDRITAVQLLPIAASIVAAGTGARVAEHLPDPSNALGTLIASYLGSIARQVFRETGFFSDIPVAGDIFFVVGTFVALIMWAFGLTWLCFTLASIYKSRPFPFKMVWWGFTFPLGVMALSTMEFGRIFPIRMKQYEASSDSSLPSDSPIVLRLDGHAFSRFTSHFCRPFDERIHDAMIATSTDLLKFFSAATVAYTQSDEITLVFPTGVQSFNGRVQKLSSLAASYCSVRFNAHLAAFLTACPEPKVKDSAFDKLGHAHFDARFFAVPTVQEAFNCILWRCRNDAVRNSVNAFARTLYSTNQMHGKTANELKDMMKIEKGVVFEEAVPKWAIEGSLLKREQVEHDGVNKKTGQVEKTSRTRTRVEDRGSPNCRIPRFQPLVELILASPVSFRDPHVENIELTETNDGQSRYNTYKMPPGLPPDGDTKYSNYNASFTPDKPAVNDWPVNSQQVAVLTPLRGSILVFDVLLASTPLLFIVLALLVARLNDKAPPATNGKLEEMLLYTPTIFPLLFAALMGSSADYQAKPADLWGNIKLPSYRAIENTTSEDWKTVPDYNSSSVTWGSLIGIPVSAFDGEDFTTHSMNDFAVKARQFSIDCTSNAQVSRNDLTNKTWPITGPWSMQTAVQQPNCTDDGGCPLKGCDAYPCPFISMSLTDGDAEMETASMAECEYYYDHVEAKVNCTESVCKVTSMRKLDMFTDGYLEDPDTFLRGVVMTNLMVALSSVDTIGVADARVRGSTNMERWLMDPASFIGAGGDNVKLYTLPPDLFAERLTVLWNTFFQVTYATRALAGYLDTAISSNITDAFGNQITFNTTQSLVSQQVIIYRVNWKWFSVLLSCSLVLLCAAYAGLVLKYLSIAPDIVGYASSLTLLNPYVPTPTGGTTLHGLERTALLHDLPVRLGDVCPNEPVGAIALAANDGRVTGLDRRRWYI
ncbi:hypothetical protein E8E11_008630 [Didymella keratinophila]|nr:hypothetical protein E8E11_008630 [Didymella keratinophila]